MVAVQVLSLYQNTTRKKALAITMLLTIIQKTKQALLDSKATENLLDPKTIIKLRLSTSKLKQPHIITNIDGTYNKVGNIIQKCQLKVILRKCIKELNFFITNLEQD